MTKYIATVSFSGPEIEMRQGEIRELDESTALVQALPQIIQTVFAENCVAVVFLLAVILNLILPKDKKSLN